MTLVTRSTDASLDAASAMYAPQRSGLEAGEALDLLAVCYIKQSDGKVYMSNATADDEAAGFDGITPRAYASGDSHVTLFGIGTKMRYGTSLTPGALYYIGATAGRVDTAVTTGDTSGVLRAINATTVRVIRDGPLEVGAASLGAGSVGTAALATNSVTNIKMADNAIDSAEIVVGAIDPAHLAASAVETAKIANSAVTFAKAAVFISAETTATGAAQNVAHGLAAVPAGVLVVPTEHPGTPDTGAFDIAEGSHTSTNVIVTVTVNVKFKVFAWA